MRRMLGVLLFLALIATSCGGDDGGAVTSAPAADRSPGALDDALAVAGITVVTPATGDSGPTGLQLTEFQVANMARGLERSQGYLGVELDRLGGSPGGLPFSFLIAGWLSSPPTRTAEAAASLMGEQEWEQASALVYPEAVLALFAADAMSSVSGAGDDEDAAPAAPVFVAQPDRAASHGALSKAGPSHLRTATESLAAPVTGVCSALATWFNDVLNFMFDSLKVSTGDGGFLGFLGSIWNAAVDLARVTIGGLIEALTAPIVAAVAEVIAVIGTLSMVASLLVPWNIDVLEDEPRTRFAVGDEPDVDNGFTARVDTNLDIDWPASVEDCARVAGFELPDPETAAGSTVDWLVAGLPRLGEEEARDSTIDENNEARFEWITGREISDGGAEQIGVVAVTAVVTSAQIGRLRAMLEVLIAAQIPVEPFGSIVGEVFAALAGPVFDELAALIESRGSTSVRVVHHDEETPTTTSGPGEAPGGEAAPWEGNVCELLTDEALFGVFGTLTAAGEPADSGTVAAEDYGGASCRWRATISEHLVLDVFPAADVDINVLAAYDPHERWYPELLGGIGDEARVLRWNGDERLGVEHGSVGAIVVLQGDVGVRLELSSGWTQEGQGLVAAARLILEGP